MKIAKFEFSLFGINTYVVYDPESRECAIIDPGMYDVQEEQALDSFIQRNNLKVKYILETHLHLDHAFGTAHARGEYGVEVLAHKDDAFLGRKLDDQARRFHLRRALTNMEADGELKEGNIIRIGNGELRVLHVPGHSPGSVALYDAADGFVITGDALFRGSIGRTDLEGGDMRTLLQSIGDKLLTLPDSTVVYPGHGPATTIGDEKRYNSFFR